MAVSILDTVPISKAEYKNITLAEHDIAVEDVPGN